MKNGLRFLATEKGKQVVLFCLGAMIVIGGVAWYYDYGQWAIHQGYVARCDELKANIQEARRLAMTVAQTAAMRTQMQRFLDAQEASMVSGDQFVWVIREISQLAESQPVANVTTQPGSLVPHARKLTRQWYVTRLEFTGEYDQVGKFVQELENHFPEGEVRSLTIVSSVDAPTIHRVALDLALLVRPVSDASQKVEPKP